MPGIYTLLTSKRTQNLRGRKTYHTGRFYELTNSSVAPLTNIENQDQQDDIIILETIHGSGHIIDPHGMIYSEVCLAGQVDS